MSTESFLPSQADLDEWLRTEAPKAHAFHDDLCRLSASLRKGEITESAFFHGLVDGRERTGYLFLVDRSGIEQKFGSAFSVPNSIMIDLIPDRLLKVETPGDPKVVVEIGLSEDGKLEAKNVEFPPSPEDFEVEEEYSGDEAYEDEEKNVLDTKETETPPEVIDALKNYFEMIESPEYIAENKANWGMAMIVALTHVVPLSKE